MKKNIITLFISAFFLSSSLVYAEEVILTLDDLYPIETVSPETQQADDLVHTHDTLEENGPVNLNTVTTEDASSLSQLDQARNIPKEIIEILRVDAQQLHEKGFLEKSNEETSIFDNMDEKMVAFKPLSKVRKKLAFKPTKDRSLRKKGYRLMGAMPTGILTPKGWTGLDRVYQSKEHGYVIFQEDHTEELSRIGFGDDMPQENLYSLRVQEMINTSVKNAPASLISTVSPNGKAVTDLAWNQNGIDYAITSQGNAGQKLFSIKKRSLPSALTLPDRVQQSTNIHILDIADDL